LKLFAKSKGFTLLEVLVAMIILSFSLLALAGLMVTTTKYNAYGSAITEAATFAQDKLEELSATKWININDGNHTDQKNGSTGIGYTRNWQVTTNSGLKTVTITINWIDRTSHSIRLVSVLAQ
jgi:prepilin-type N-terminal cleavage/methylation domain-containing protein